MEAYSIQQFDQYTQKENYFHTSTIISLAYIILAYKENEVSRNVTNNIL